MECNRARELIQEKLEGELDARLRPEMTGHLVACPECRAFEQGLEALDSLMSREPFQEAPEGFAARVLDAASRRRRRMLTYERRNLRVAAACIAAILVAAFLLPFFVSIPDASALKEEVAAMAPVLPDTSYLPSSLSDLAPQIPESGQTLADAADHLKHSWDSLSTVNIPSLGLTSTLVLILAALAAVAAAFEVAYFILPYRRRK